MRLNESSDLLPAITMPVSSTSVSSISDLSIEANGSASVFFTSTPVRDDLPDLFTVGSPVNTSTGTGTLNENLSDSSLDFEIMSSTRNRPRRVRYTESESAASSDDCNLPWQDRKLKCMKYVDDCLSIERINFKKSKIDETAYVRARKSQNHFHTVEYNGNSRGMKLNYQKTRMLCISAASSYTPIAYVDTPDGSRITSESSMKVLGFMFGQQPNVKDNMKSVQRKFRSRVWSLSPVSYTHLTLPTIYSV